MRDPAELEQLFREILGAKNVHVTMYDQGNFSLEVRELSCFSSEDLEDIEANNVFIEQWWYDSKDSPSFVMHGHLEGE